MLDLTRKPHFIKNSKTYIIICPAPGGFYLCDVEGTPTMVSKSIVEKMTLL